MTLNVSIQFEDILKLVDSLTPEQKLTLHEHIEAGWTEQFGTMVENFFASQLPADDITPDSAVNLDVEATVADAYKGPL